MAKFIKSATTADMIGLDDQITEFCFIGRSNVGKSTLINALANEKISKTSKTPGLTQLINIFDFKDYRIVDLPGYGYAKVSKNKKFEITNMINDYINNRPNLFCVFMICDIQTITELDKQVYKDVCTRFNNVYVILNKADKVNKSYFDNNKVKIAKTLNIDVSKLIPISAANKINIAYIKKLMNVMTKKIK